MKTEDDENDVLIKDELMKMMNDEKWELQLEKMMNQPKMKTEAEKIKIKIEIKVLRSENTVFSPPPPPRRPIQFDDF